MQSPSSRLQLLCNHLSTPKQPTPVFSSLDFCFFDDLLTPEEAQFRREVREFAEKEITPVISDYYEQAKFPQPLFEKIGEKGWLKGLLAKPEGEGKGPVSIGLLLLEIARVDGSMATTLFVHLGVLLYNIQTFGSEEQKKKLIPDMVKLKKYCGWGLTEPNVGSDAASLETMVKKVPGGYEITGQKRWPGNADKDMLIVWAKREDTKKVEGFIVPVTGPGVKVEVIERKLSMRCVQNSHITMEKVFVPEENKLPKADKGFMSISQELAHSRILASWIAVGMAVGVYDNVIKYINDRKQFGVKISSFQLTQEKLSRMMGHIQAMMLMAWRVTRLDEQKKMTSGMSSMTKAWTTSLCREVTRLGREMLGGNGIIADNYVMKALADIEGLYTYEGTYDVNVLVLGRELTGINAFKSK